MNSYLTRIQAETLARLYYGLPERNYKGKPLARNWQVHACLVKKGCIEYNRISERGIRELGRFCRVVRK